LLLALTLALLPLLALLALLALTLPLLLSARLPLRSAYLALTANVVTTAIAQASLRSQLAVTRELLAAEEKQLSLIERQFALGGVARGDVLNQRTLVAQTRASIPGLEKQLAQSGHALAVLAGELPSAFHAPPFDLESLALPDALPVSLPSALVRQRPDILASEAQLHYASAQVGVALSNLFPQFNLNASLGLEALTLGTLFGPGSAVSALGGSVLQPLFRGGSLQALERGAQAALDQARAQYRQTVLQGFQNVADALRALSDDARALQAQAAASGLAGQTLDLTRRQYELQAVSYINLLTAQRQYEQSRLSLVSARAARLSDTVALFQALGGGWWNEAPAAGVAPMASSMAAASASPTASPRVSPSVSSVSRIVSPSPAGSGAIPAGAAPVARSTSPESP
jgi:NodT family efflux transporter outer membrane factor (OMF) lipoprotein